MSREVEDLRLELLAVEAEFGRKIAKLKHKIDEVQLQQSSIEKTASDIKQDALAEEQSSPITSSQVENKVVVEEKPSKYSNPKVSSSVTDQLSKFILFIFSCFNDWLAPVTRIVTSYKERGLLPVFLLTIVGIALVLAGFGYWMQYVIESMEGAQKSMLMGLLSIVVITVGGFIKRKTSFSEFATAIVALGVLLGYSTVHFVGNVYEILSPTNTLLGYIVVTAIAHILAWRFDTKILVSLGIVGIAVMPIIASVSMGLSDIYLVSLLLAIGSGFWFALKRSFFWLGPLSLGFVSLAIEWSLVSSSVSLWVINLSYLLFLCYFLASIYREQTSNNNLKLVIASVGVHLALMLQLEGFDSQALLVCMLINAAFSLCAYVYGVRQKLAQNSIQLLLIGLWLALAVIVALNAKVWGIAWCFEGLLLALLSKRLNSKSALYQGQGLLAIGLVFSLVAIAPYFPEPALARMDGWGIALSVLFCIRVWCFAIKNSYTYLNDFTENRLLPVITTVEAVLTASLVMGASFVIFGDWTGAIIILVQAALLFQAQQTRLIAIDIFALILAVIPLALIISGANTVGSYRFTELPDFAKLATITSFVQLWLWSEFYRRVAPDNKLSNVAEKVRIAFYALLPICWLSSASRHFGDNVIMLLWLSPLIAVVLSTYVKHRFLVFEAKLLLALGALVWVISSMFASNSGVVIGFCGFGLMFIVSYLLTMKHQLEQQAGFIFTTALVSFGFAIPILAVQMNAHAELAWQIFALYWLSCFVLARKAKRLWQNERLITLMSLLALVLSWGLSADNVHFSIIPFYFAMACLIRHRANTYQKSWLSKWFKPHHSLFLHTLAIASYVAWCFGAKLSILIGPALAAHAIGILLMTKANLATIRFAFLLIFSGVLKIAFVDAVTSSQGEKVLLFVGVGGAILLASFWYQKLLGKLREP